MKHPWRIGCLSILLACAGCTAWVVSDQPGSAPDSASIAVEPTPAGLADLFQRVCIDQKERDWARSEAARRLRWDCWGGEDGDCADNDTYAVSYLVPTTDHATVVAEILPTRDPNDPDGCSLYVGNRHAPALLKAIALLRRGGRHFEQTGGAGGTNWHIVPGHDILSLSRAFVGDCKPGECPGDIFYCSSATYMADHPCYPDRWHPWELFYRP